MSQFGQDLGLPVTWLRAELEERVAENQDAHAHWPVGGGNDPASTVRRSRLRAVARSSHGVLSDQTALLASARGMTRAIAVAVAMIARSGINSAASRLTISPLRQATWVVRVDAENLAPVRREVDRLPAPQMISLQRSQLRSNGCSGGLRSSP